MTADQKERLYSNLLLVKRFPFTVFIAPALEANEKKVRDELHELNKVIPPFGIKDGTLFTFSDPRHRLSVLKLYCDFDATEEERSHQWRKGRPGDFTYLLNQLMGAHLRRCGLIYSRDYKRNYFPAPEDEEETDLKKTWTNTRTGRTSSRSVTKLYKYGKERFWRHLAVHIAFRNVGDFMFLEIIPKSFYTYDGFREPYDHEKVGSLTTTIRAKEHNPQVLLHVLFWADIFSQQEASIRVKLHNRAVMEIEKKPLSSIANFAIPNDTKMVDEEDASQVDLVAASLALALDLSSDGEEDESDLTQDEDDGWDEEGYFDRY